MNNQPKIEELRQHSKNKLSSLVNTLKNPNQSPFSGFSLFGDSTGSEQKQNRVTGGETPKSKSKKTSKPKSEKKNPAGPKEGTSKSIGIGEGVNNTVGIARDMVDGVNTGKVVQSLI